MLAPRRLMALPSSGQKQERKGSGALALQEKAMSRTAPPSPIKGGFSINHSLPPVRIARQAGLFPSRLWQRQWQGMRAAAQSKKKAAPLVPQLDSCQTKIGCVARHLIGCARLIRSPLVATVQNWPLAAASSTARQPLCRVPLYARNARKGTKTLLYPSLFKRIRAKYALNSLISLQKRALLA